MKARGAIVSLGLLVWIVACGSPNYDRDMSYAVLGDAGTGPLIVVEEFELAVVPDRYDARGQWVAVGVAQSVVRQLRTLGHRAVARPQRALEPLGDLTVFGTVIRADGGSVSARQWVGMGAGSAVLDVTVKVVDRGGIVLGEFKTERRSSRALSSVVLMDACADRVGLDVASWLSKSQL